MKKWLSFSSTHLTSDKNSITSRGLNLARMWQKSFTESKNSADTPNLSDKANHARTMSLMTQSAQSYCLSSRLSPTFSMWRAMTLSECFQLVRKWTFNWLSFRHSIYWRDSLLQCKSLKLSQNHHSQKRFILHPQAASLIQTIHLLKCHIRKWTPILILTLDHRSNPKLKSQPSPKLSIELKFQSRTKQISRRNAWLSLQ